MSECALLNNPNVISGWTFTPVNYYGYYTTYYDSYEAALTTSITLSQWAQITMTMLCMTTQPNDFSLNLLANNCPNSTLGNITANLGYFNKGLLEIVLEIAVRADQPSSQWLEINQIWLTACSDPPDTNIWWIIGIVVFFSLFPIIAIILYCRSKKRYNLLDQINALN